MIRYFTLAVGQLTDPRMRGVLWLGVLGALAIFVALWGAVWWLLQRLEQLNKAILPIVSKDIPTAWESW